MDHQWNGPARVSLAAGIGTVVLVFVGFCLAGFPILNLLNALVYPLQLVLAFVAIVSGIVGYRTSAALYGVGKSSSFSGFCLGCGVIGLRLLMWLFG